MMNRQRAKRTVDKALRTACTMLLLFWLIVLVYVAAEVIHAWRIWLAS